ncbi:MAG: hypothetical protein JWQ35_659, partial [Bacteriovoracaceae bacterium]|nr:hypothetical protein [Bacteriovoracaceae bacterium]
IHDPQGGKWMSQRNTLKRPKMPL